MHMVFEVFGDSLLTLRIPSVLAMAAAASLAADLGARLAGRWSGLGAGLAFALLPTLQTYAQEGRPYAMVTATVALASWLLVAAMHRPCARTWSAYALVVLLGALLNWFSLLALLAHAATLALARPHRAIWARWLLAASTAVLGALPLVLASQGQSGQVSWIQPTAPGTMYAVAATILAAGGCALLRRARKPAGPTPAAAGKLSLSAVAVPLCAVPQLMLLAVSLTWQPLYVDRYVLFAHIGLALLLGALIATRATSLPTHPRVLLAAVTALAFLALLPVAQHVRSAHSRVDDVLAAATLVDAARGQGGAVVFIPSARRDTAPVTQARSMDCATSRSPRAPLSPALARHRNKPGNHSPRNAARTAHHPHQRRGDPPRPQRPRPRQTTPPARTLRQTHHHDPTRPQYHPLRTNPSPASRPACRQQVVSRPPCRWPA
ncbi:glycosyltransferase family 39 protein [Streptomyces sp. NPDC052236]|uniref:glycosyltransferase family 39 protein n=1 Tax=Streptomyces sp. NPDC052236 TaxID=3365686 RepID=UPI0037D6E991